MNLKIKDILKVTSGKLLIGDENTECESFSKDTRNIKNGDTYIGIKGEKFNGSLFWDKALELGAKAVIIEDVNIDEKYLQNYQGKNIIVVNDTKKALIQIATEKRNLYKDLKVIGITGSVGKTSTKDMIANVLSQKYKTLKTIGNNNNDIGLPMTILNLRDHEVAVIEMGMNHLGEIRVLTKIAKPTLSVITNVGTSHIGLLGSRENILKAKLEILEGMKNKEIIINNDNDMLSNWSKGAKDCKIHTFGIDNNSECSSEDIEIQENLSYVNCSYNGEKIELNVPVGSKIFVLNALCAVLVGKLMELSNEDIKKGIESFELTGKRMELVHLKNGSVLINDSYNASYDSMKVALEYLENIEAERKIAVLGDMYELGEFSEKLHKKVGKEVDKDKIDLLFTVGKDAKYISEVAVQNGMSEDKILYFENIENLEKDLKHKIKKGDAILFKAAHGMRLFEVVDNLKKTFN